MRIQIAPGYSLMMAMAVFRASIALAAESETTPFYQGLGEMILVRIPTAPFPHPKRADGYRYGEEFFPGDRSYQDDTVGIFIPQNFSPGEKVDFVVHFHGWRNNVTNVLRQHKLIDQFAASGKNAILVVPQGPVNAADSFGGKLEDSGGFERFMHDVLATLQRTRRLREGKIGQIILSGHSGGYHVISSILDAGGLTPNVTEVWIFDGLYGQSEKFKNWIDQANGRFIDFYTANGGTKTETEELMSQLKHEGTRFLAADEIKITPDQIRDNRLQFIFTELPHDDVVHRHKTFLQFLQSSGLADILPGQKSARHAE